MEIIFRIFVAFCVLWTFLSAAYAVGFYFDNRARRKNAPRPPTRTPPLQPWTGRVLPYVNARPQAERLSSKQQQWLDDWRANNSLVAHPEIGDEYSSISRHEERRLTLVK